MRKEAEEGEESVKHVENNGQKRGSKEEDTLS